MIEEVKLVIGMAVLQYGNLRIDPNQRRVYVNEQVVELNSISYIIWPYTLAGPLPGSSFTDMRCPMTLLPASKASPAGSTRYGKN